uniref:Uncharacterized protein n=1 Tax=Heterorhabditis bacteriophora TaxID=37862 RepID=A0A1I7W958_HETBA
MEITKSAITCLTQKKKWIRMIFDVKFKLLPLLHYLYDTYRKYMGGYQLLVVNTHLYIFCFMASVQIYLSFDDYKEIYTYSTTNILRYNINIVNRKIYFNCDEYKFNHKIKCMST